VASEPERSRCRERLERLSESSFDGESIQGEAIVDLGRIIGLRGSRGFLQPRGRDAMSLRRGSAGVTLKANFALRFRCSIGRTGERRKQLAPAVDSDLVEHRLEMVLDRVGRDEEALRDRTSVESGNQQRDYIALPK
jgi:hypothetical protein